MTRELLRPSRRAVAASGIAGALLIATLVTLGIGGSGAVPGAAAAAPAPPVPAPAVEQETPRVTFVGDSWTEGFGATALRGYAVLTGEQLGWDYDLLAIGGSGYSLRGVAGQGATYAERVDRVVAIGADVIVVQGSLNERNSTREALAAAALAALAGLRAEADPATRIVVLGAAYPGCTPHATIDWINAAIEDAAARAGVGFVDVAAENWTDPADPTVWFDPIHPNDAGYQLIADRLQRLLLDEPDH
jgi:lysophospholipase L1-like esterase